MPLLHLPAAARIAKAWKNGGGVTRDVIIIPEGAGLDDFDWRLSIAEVASDGPFSQFPGVDRIIAILSGTGITLEVKGCPAIRLTPQSGPHAFPGDATASGMLIGGPIRDLNLMTRRGTISARMHRVDITRETEFMFKPGVILWVSGRADIAEGSTVISPDTLDALHISAFTPLVITPHTPCSFYRIEIEAA